MKTRINYLIILFLLLFVQNSKDIKNIYCENVNNVQEAKDCFNTLLDEDYETCCFFEFKNKNKYVRERYCIPIELPQFLNIGDTIKEIEKNNKDIKIYSLECDKNNYLSLGISVFIIIFLL